MNVITRAWTRYSRNGLREDEGVMEHREVILLNKILIVSPIIVAMLIPFEIAINGFELVPLELAFMALIMLPFFFQRYRLFWFARLYAFTMGNLFIVVAGTLVGKGVNNHVALIPLMLFGLILFKTNKDRVMIFGLSLLFYFTLRYLIEVIPPSYYVSQESKDKFSIIFYVMTLLLTFLLGYYFIGINNDYQGLIITQREALALRNKEVLDSINYAKRIQQAKLPKTSDILKVLPDSFVLFKPKDIVSGDFYFFHDGGNEILLAAADCTGHGVPGALMSMLGSEQLSKAANQTTDVSDILQMINVGIKQSLQQTMSVDSTRDGMDIALCSVDRVNRIVRFAGANRPLWLIRSGEISISELAPTKCAIGGYTEDEQNFETQEIQLNAGDTFYIFTDGYADTFGGEGNKKLTSKRFKQVLLGIQQQPMAAQQRSLDQFIEEWKSGTEQVDDILVIGVRL